MPGSADAFVTPVCEGTYDLRFERRYALQAANVWAVLTVPDQIADWLAEAEVKLRLGGRFTLRGQCEVDGVIVELDAPYLLAWTWPHPAHPESVVRWQIVEEQAGCRLVLTQTRLGAAELLSVAAGWHTHLEGLPGAVDGVRTTWSAEREALHVERYRSSLPI